MDRYLFAFLIIQFFRFGYLQDTNVCEIGYQLINGSCIPSVCPSGYVFISGECHIQTVSNNCRPNFIFMNGVCVQQNCPTNYVMMNGFCYPHTSVTPMYCPTGYYYYTGTCLSIVPSQNFCQPRPCFTIYCINTCFDNTNPTTATTSTTTTTTTSTATPPTTTTTTTPAPCSSNTVEIEGECRLIYCTKGTVYKGRCLEPVCSDGMVWSGRTCTKPEVITTILEIENNYVTGLNQTGPVFQPPNNTKTVKYHTENASMTSTDDSHCNTTWTPEPGTKCCAVITPRMCRRYSTRWICFNRQYRRCDNFCGNYSMIYLSVPNGFVDGEMVIVPHNPTLRPCPEGECETSGGTDCSGCLKSYKETCSPYCYHYRCPSGRCRFISQFEYCTKYPKSPGCSSFDGCIQSWCSGPNEGPSIC